MSEFVRILDAAQVGDAKAQDDLLPSVYNELRQLAARKMAHESGTQTLLPLFDALCVWRAPRFHDLKEVEARLTAPPFKSLIHSLFQRLSGFSRKRRIVWWENRCWFFVKQNQTRPGVPRLCGQLGDRVPRPRMKRVL